jgi:ankyrin-2
LHLASREGNVDLAHLLIERGADVTAQAKNRQTALHLASELGNVGVAHLLIEHGADVTTQKKDRASVSTLPT